MGCFSKIEHRDSKNRRVIDNQKLVETLFCILLMIEDDCATTAGVQYRYREEKEVLTNHYFLLQSRWMLPSSFINLEGRYGVHMGGSSECMDAPSFRICSNQLRPDGEPRPPLRPVLRLQKRPCLFLYEFPYSFR